MQLHKTGLVVEGDNWRALATGVETLVITPEQMRQMAQAARQYARNRSFDQAFDRHWTLYEKDDLAFRQSAVNQLR